MAKNKKKTGYEIRCAAAEALKIQGSLETGYNYDWNIYVDNVQNPNKITLLKHAAQQSNGSGTYNFVFNMDKIASVIGKEVFSKLFTNANPICNRNYQIVFYLILDDGKSYSYVKWDAPSTVFDWKINSISNPIDCSTDKGWTIIVNAVNNTINSSPYNSTLVPISCSIQPLTLNFSNCSNRAKTLCTKEREDGFGGCDQFANWYKKIPKKCCYCGVEEKDLTEYFNEDNCQTKDARQRGEYLEIERVVTAPAECNVYSVDNTKLACYVCNNAKSDFLSPKSFKPIARGINQFWQQQLKKYVKFPECDDIWNKDVGCLLEKC